mmetsp:Transcript_89550/g.249093  ORF Transcript_89550/g.249093 Transcript_89550/m.249093 type:complete len:172 (-) Transcript_89550:150-665(-)
MVPWARRVLLLVLALAPAARSVQSAGREGSFRRGGAHDALGVAPGSLSQEAGEAEAQFMNRVPVAVHHGGCLEAFPGSEADRCRSLLGYLQDQADTLVDLAASPDLPSAKRWQRCAFFTAKLREMASIKSACSKSNQSPACWHMMEMDFLEFYHWLEGLIADRSCFTQRGD